MISIIVDEKEFKHVRSLAAYGFKPYLASNPEKVNTKTFFLISSTDRTKFYVTDVRFPLAYCSKPSGTFRCACGCFGSGDVFKFDTDRV